MTEPTQRRALIWREPMVGVFAAWAVGVCLSAWIDGSALVWLIASGGCGLAGAAVRRTSLCGPVVLMAIALAAAGWYGLRTAPGPMDISGYLGDESQLADVSGRVVQPPRLSAERPEGLARFMYSTPTTSLFLAVDTLHTPGGDVAVSGAVLVSVPAADTRPRAGDRLRAQGWLSRIGPASNPGERDFAGAMASLGVRAKMRLNNRGNWRVVESGGSAAWPRRLNDWVRSVHAALSGAAGDALRAGNADDADAQATALLDAMVLGQRSDELNAVYESFRRTGLAHVLAISGLHVGLLAVGVWFAVQVLTSRPQWAAIAAMVVVGCYLTLVPWRVPIVRAGFMTIVFCSGLSLRRRLSATSLMALIGLVLLIVRPGDLFKPGFQLSFGIVAALLAFVQPVSAWLMPDPLDPADRGWVWALRRRLCDYFAVSFVAWLTALPIVAYHFQMISPLAVGMSVLALPAVAVVLWLGFAKVAIGMAWPTAGAWLAGPLTWLAEWQVGVVGRIAEWPGAAITVPQPSAWWAGATLMVVVTFLAGGFARRPIALAVCVLVCSGWLTAPRWVTHLPGVDAPQLTVHMLAVGDGSCFIVQSGGETWLYDCGSSNYAEIGRYAIVPALRALAIDSIDTLVISHADYDHFSGALDIVDHIAIGRVVTTQHLLDDAAAEPRKATGYLVEQLRERGVAIDTAAQGWQTTLGTARVEALWPPVGRRFETNNDASLVLAFTTEARRLLLCGDIQEQAMAAMLGERIDLPADVTDLPHHGSFPPGAVEWLRAVGPTVVLQSSGKRRLDWDKWAGHLDGIERHITARSGAVTLSIFKDGRITTRRHRD